MGLIRSAFGYADSFQMTATGAQAITISNTAVFIDGTTVIATGNRTINLTISPEVKNCRIFIKSKTTSTEQTIPGTNMIGPTITGVAGKTFTVEYIYDGVGFKPCAAAVQID